MTSAFQFKAEEASWWSGFNSRPAHLILIGVFCEGLYQNISIYKLGHFTLIGAS